MPTKVLIAVSSYAGATREIGNRIAKVLRAHGLDVTVEKAEEVLTIAPYGAIVFGGAVYNGGWLPQASEFIARYQKLAKFRKVFAFSAGPLGQYRVPEGGPELAEDQAEELGAQEHVVFTGSLNKTGLKSHVLTVAAADGETTPDEDYRDWSAIEAWAERIANEIGE